MMNGVIVIDKPAGKTSHDVVGMVKKILKVKKAGHTGTLDPLATGVLPVCLNEATKLAGFLTGERKEYRATMLLGVITDTLDVQGKVVGRFDGIKTEEEIKAALSRKIGRIRQVPPSFSAIKYHGKPLYKWARRGIMLEALPREVEIQSLVVERISYPEVTFRVTCSKGTYIRSLCADVGEELGCGACLSGLRRLKSGCFSEDMAVKLESADLAGKTEEMTAKIRPMAELLPLLKTIEVDEDFADKVRDGFQPSVKAIKGHVLPFLDPGDMVKFVTGDGCLVALAEMTVAVNNFSNGDENRQAAKIVRVFKNA